MDEVVVVGESLVDVVHRDGTPSRELPGGSAANAAVALARLEVPVRLVTALGRDARGDALAEHLTDEGVGWGTDPRVLEFTATAEATIGVDGSASYSFDIGWRLDDSVATWTPRPGVLLVSSLAPVLEPGATQVLALAARVGRGCPVVYDVNARPAVTGSGPRLVAAVQAMTALSDLVKASDEDLEVLVPGAGPEEAARRLVQEGAGAVVVSLGADGAMWVDHDRVVRVAGVPVVVADTIGAGDTLGAALVRWLLAGGAMDRRPGAPAAPWRLTDGQVEEALTWAGRAASVTVSRPGADPPTLAELTG